MKHVILVRAMLVCWFTHSDGFSWSSACCDQCCIAFVRVWYIAAMNPAHTGPRIGIKVRSTFMPPATLWSLMRKEMHGLVESALVVPVSKDSACRNCHADHMLNFRLIGPSIHYRPTVKAHP